jgi:hypothetical protein
MAPYMVIGRQAGRMVIYLVELDKCKSMMPKLFHCEVLPVVASSCFLSLGFQDPAGC